MRRSLLLPLLVTTASLGVLVITMAGAGGSSADHAPPSAEPPAPVAISGAVPAPGQPAVAGLSAAVQRVLARHGYASVMGRDELLDALPESVVDVLSEERAALPLPAEEAP